MTFNSQHHNPKDAILEQIRSGTLTMRPKTYFLLKASMIALVAVAVLFVSILIAGFMVFTLRLNGSDALLMFGPRGIHAFVQVFPWPLLIIDVALLILLESLLRRFRFVYSRSVLYVLLVLMITIGTIAIVIEHEARFHERLFMHAYTEGLPSPLQEWYERAPLPAFHELGIFRGVVVSYEPGMFVMTNDDFDEDEDDSLWTVIIPEAFDESTIQIGDRFLVAGDEEREGTVRAYGIHELFIRGNKR